MNTAQQIVFFVGLISGVLSLAGLIYAKLKGHFKKPLDEEHRLERIEDMLDLPKGSTVLGIVNSQGQRLEARIKAIEDLDASREALRQRLMGEWEEHKQKVRDMSTEQGYLRERVAGNQKAIESCLDENREAAREQQRQLTDIAGDIREIKTELRLRKTNGGLK